MKPTDDEIAEMLMLRADRVSSEGLVHASLGELGSRPRSSRRGSRPSWQPSLVWGVAILAVVAIVGVSLPNLSHPTASTAVSPGTSTAAATAAPASPVPSALIGPPAAIEAISASDLGVLLRTSATALADTIVAVDGKLVLEPKDTCDGTCHVVVSGAGAGFAVVPTGDIGPGPWDGSGPIDGTFALKITGGRVDGRLILEYIGRIDPAPDGLAWTVEHLLSGPAALKGGDLVAVHGWLVATPLHPCPSSSESPRPGDQFYRCGQEDYLTQDRFQPVGPDGVSGPAHGLFLPSDSYRDWAPDPAQAAGGYEPREATYLLQWSPFNCDDVHTTVVSDCFLDPTEGAWFIRGRLAATPSHVWTVAELASLGFQGTGEFVVEAWLVATPPLRCQSKPLPSGVPDLRCGEVDWLTDDPFVPWVDGSARSPDIGIRVPNGSYDLFAPDPSTLTDGSRAPRHGTFLVQRSMLSTCDFAANGRDPSCLGGPVSVTMIERRITP
jgi:hypothetical protein